MTGQRDGGAKDTFAGDTVWNFLAFAVMAGVGVILNFFIAGYLGAAALGVFNQGYAVFVVFGQLAALGIHDSAQKHVAEYVAADPGQARLLAGAAIPSVLLVALPIAAVLYVLHPTLGHLADSTDVGLTIAVVAPGVALFSTNKVLMGILNGRMAMRTFAAGQAIRGVAILAVCLALGIGGAAPWWLAGCFTAAEAILLPILLIVTRPYVDWSISSDVRSWIGRHMHFGLRAMPNSFLAESYIRVDVIMLAFFVGDAEIGVYSFAAMFIEGLYQVPVVVRTVANPRLVGLVKAGNRAALVAFARKIALLGLAAGIFVAAGILIVFPSLGPYFPDGMIERAHGVLQILIVGVIAYSPFIPLDHVLLQAGMPARQSVLMAANVAGNVVLNLLLIPRFGIAGAAMATAASFTISGITLNVAAARWLGYRRSLLVDAG